MSDLDLLREITQRVHQPAFDELVETRRRRTRRRRTLTAVTLAVAATAAIGVLAATGTTTRTDAPPTGPSPSPSPSASQKLEIPAGQHTVTADIRPRDIHGFDLVATLANTQSEHAKDTYLQTTVTVPADSSYTVYDCRAHDVPTWVAYADGDLVSDSPGGAHDWWSFRPCDAGDPLSLELDADLPESPFDLGSESKTVRMFAFAAPTGAQRDCLGGDSPADCPLPDPIASTDAEFGFRIYEHRWAPQPALRIIDHQGNGSPYEFEAVSSINGVAWQVDRAVLAAPGANRLALELPTSNVDYLIDVYDGHSAHVGRCLEQHADEIPDFESTDHGIYEAAVARLCYAKLRLVVDGSPVALDERDAADRGHFTDLGGRLSSGAVHQVEVQVTHGDPRNIQYAVVVRTLARLP